MNKRQEARAMTITITERPGICRWCGCTYDTPCENGCGWANRAQTLCTECVDLDKRMRSVAGRKALADLVQRAEYDR